jgi:hypothetical protein
MRMLTLPTKCGKTYRSQVKRIGGGDEIYFSTPVSLHEEHARAEVEVGAVAYWPPGKAVCIFFGKTPASKHGEPRAASPVNVFAKVVGDLTTLRKVQDGDQITLAKADTP